jgi:hypothetical protein
LPPQTTLPARWKVQAGILQAGNGTALGTAAAGTTVAPVGTLDVNGQILGGEVITVSGAGAGGVGAIINTGGAQNWRSEQL